MACFISVCEQDWVYGGVLFYGADYIDADMYAEIDGVTRDSYDYAQNQESAMSALVGAVQYYEVRYGLDRYGEHQIIDDPDEAVDIYDDPDCLVYEIVF